MSVDISKFTELVESERDVTIAVTTELCVRVFGEIWEPHPMNYPCPYSKSKENDAPTIDRVCRRGFIR